MEPVPSTSNSHLTYPKPTTVPEEDVPTKSQPRLLLKDRLYVGNLHPTVDEYSLLQIFSKFGRVTKLDFLFHKTGPSKGKPRGYAFLEYGNEDDARKALLKANDKLFRGRKLVVTFAHQAPLDQAGGFTPYGTGSSGKHKRGVAEAGRPTTLSLLKGGAGGRNDATKNKIAMMEAKLRQMEQSKPTGSSPSSITHPSLPQKPPSAPANPDVSSESASASFLRFRALSKTNVRAKPTLPSLPILPQTPSELSTSRLTLDPNGAKSCKQVTYPTRSVPKGVRITKFKNRGELDKKMIDAEEVNTT